MPTDPSLRRLPPDLSQRFKRAVPAQEKRAYLGQLLEQAEPAEGQENDPLYLVGLAAEQDEGLTAEMADWQEATTGDGLADLPPFKPAN